MGRDHDRATGVAQVLQEGEQLGFRFCIKRRARFVKQQDRRVKVEGAGKGQSLALTAGEVRAVFGQVSKETLGQVLDELQHADFAAEAEDAFHVGPVVARGKVLQDGAGEQVRLLRHDGEVPAKARQLKILQVDFANQPGGAAKPVPAEPVQQPPPVVLPAAKRAQPFEPLQQDEVVAFKRALAGTAPAVALSAPGQIVTSGRRNPAPPVEFEETQMIDPGDSASPLGGTQYGDLN